LVNKQENLEIAKDIFLKGDEKLKSAKILMQNQLFDDSISRIYYSVFYFVKSLLFLLGEEPKTHKGMKIVFGLKVIKTDLMDKKFGRILNDLFEKRENSDYSIYTYLDFETTENLLHDAITFREEIKKILKEKFDLIV